MIYPVGETPTFDVRDVGLLVDQRVQEHFIGTTFRPAGLYVPDLTTHIPTPLDVSTKPAVIGTNLLLAALLMLPFAAAVSLFTQHPALLHHHALLRGDLLAAGPHMAAVHHYWPAVIVQHDPGLRHCWDRR